MLSTTALLLSSLSFVSAFTAPANQPDGVYRAYFDETGKEVHELLTPGLLLSSAPEGADVILSSAPATTAVTPRYAGNPLLTKRRDNIYCGCGFTLNPGDCDAVVANLKAQFGSGYTFINPRMSYYSIMGRSVVAFVCNYSDRAYLGVSAQTYGDWLGVITGECGRYIAGSEGTPGSSSQGYMRSGGDFCANALTSPAHHC